MMRRLLFLAILLQVFTLMAVAPLPWHGNAYAQVGTPAAGHLQTRDESGATMGCAAVTEAKGGVLLGVIMPCLTYTIEQSTISFSRQMVDWLRPLLYTFLTIVIVMFGVRMLQHEPQLEKQGFLLVLKVALVIGILDQLPEVIVPDVYAIMSESQSIVMHTLDGTSFGCNVADFGDTNTPPVWATMDCVMGKLFGFTAGTGVGANGEKTPNMFLAASMFGLISGFLFSGAWGVVVFFGMMGVLISMFMLVVRTAMGVLMGYMIACVMLILCPLFLPLIFMRSTQSYFEGVMRNLMAAFVMPVLIAAYAMFALVIYDKMLFAPDSIIQQIFNYDKVKDALQNSRKICDWQVAGDPTATRLGATPTDTQVDDLFKPNSRVVNNIQSLVSGGNDLCARALVPNLNIKDINDPAFQNDKETYERIFYDLIKLFLLAWLIYKGMDNLNSVVVQITGMVSSRIGFQPLPGEEKIQSSINNIRQQAHSVKNLKGAAFAEKMPSVARGGIKSALGIQDKK